MLHSSLPKRVERKKNPKTQISHAIVVRCPLCVPLLSVGLFWKWLSLEVVVFLVMHYLHSLCVTILILPISVHVSIYIVYIYLHTHNVLNWQKFYIPTTCTMNLCLVSMELTYDTLIFGF